MVRALVTGAGGFIGSHVAFALLRQGYDVRALLRPGGEGRRRAHLPPEIEPATGDVRDFEAVARAARGCQVLFHIAAVYELWTADPRGLFEVNVEGTRTVLAAARSAGVERVVYTSSVSTLVPGGNEDNPADARAVHSAYKRSKILAEQVALTQPEVVVVNPSTPVGWGDVRPTPTGKVVLDFLRGRMPAYVDTGLNLVDVEDVALGHLLALSRGQPGRRYILGNENVTLYRLFEMLAAEVGGSPPRIRLPYALALTAGAVSEFVEGRIVRRPPTVPLEGVRMSRTPMYYDPSRAREELGLPASPVRAALRKSAEWFQANGYC